MVQRKMDRVIWPTMLTPFNASNQVDYPVLEKMIDWYNGYGIRNFYAVCFSSEIMNLTQQERMEIARFVRQHTDKTSIVVATGHVPGDLGLQMEDIRRTADTGVDIVVLATSFLAVREEGDDLLQQRLEMILSAMKGVQFGLYECPIPYKRLLTPALLSWCAETGRFTFLKDTCCDRQTLKHRMDILRDTGLHLYNANSITFLDSLKYGASGYCGIMANFHPDLYVWLAQNWDKQKQAANKLQAFLGIAALVECHDYPVNAKYYMQLENVPISLVCRMNTEREFTDTYRLEMMRLQEITQDYRSFVCAQDKPICKPKENSL